MRVLVTRPEPEAGTTAERLRGRGHEVLVAPVMTAVPLAGPMPVEQPGALAVTSGRTAGFLDPTVTGALRHLPVFAVGARTASALADAGFHDIRIADGNVQALARLIAAAGLPAGNPILHPGGEERAADLGELLAGSPVTVVPWTIYRMRPAEALPAEVADALRAGRVDAVLHYSPRSAAILADLLVAAGLAAPAAGALHACLSPTVAAALAPLAPIRIAIAPRPDEGSLIQLLDRAPQPPLPSSGLRRG